MKSSDPEGNEARTSDIEGKNTRKTKMSNPEVNEANKTETINLEGNKTK